MWERKMMEIIYSPYHACQAVTWAKCISMVYQLDPNKPFAWEKMLLKFPGSVEYYFQRPWVFKQMVDGLLDVDFFIYVNNGRTI